MPKCLRFGWTPKHSSSPYETSIWKRVYSFNIQALQTMPVRVRIDNQRGFITSEIGTYLISRPSSTSGINCLHSRILRIALRVATTTIHYHLVSIPLVPIRHAITTINPTSRHHLRATVGSNIHHGVRTGTLSLASSSHLID